MSIPVEIVGLHQPEVRIVWDEQHETIFTAHTLRQMCRCAFCKEEMTGRPLLDPATVPDDITVEDMELVGTYGLRIAFSDNHKTGIFRFRDLLAACRCNSCHHP